MSLRVLDDCPDEKSYVLFPAIFLTCFVVTTFVDNGAVSILIQTLWEVYLK